MWTDYIILFCFVNRLYYCCVNCIDNEKKKFRFASELVVQNSKLAAEPHVKNVWTVPDSKSPIFKTDSEAGFYRKFYFVKETSESTYQTIILKWPHVHLCREAQFSIFLKSRYCTWIYVIFLWLLKLKLNFVFLCTSLRNMMNQFWSISLISESFLLGQTAMLTQHSILNLHQWFVSEKVLIMLLLVLIILSI